MVRLFFCEYVLMCEKGLSAQRRMAPHSASNGARTVKFVRQAVPLIETKKA